MTNNQKQIAKIFITVIGHGLLVAVPLLMHAYTLTRDLKLGDSGDDVKALQTILNTDARTRVSLSGPGSSGQETGFFGEKTQAAVVRYQNLNADSVLRPLGLSEGTGFVGSATRKQLSGATDSEIAKKASISDAIAAFDAITSGAAESAVRSPVDDARIPKTEEELFTAVEDFAGSKATEEEIQDFSRQMVLARYGYPTTLGSSSSDDGGTGTPRSQCSDGINNDSGEDTLIDYPKDPDCTNASDNTERGGGTTHSGTGGQDASGGGGSGAGCIALLFTFLGL